MVINIYSIDLVKVLVLAMLVLLVKVPVLVLLVFPVPAIVQVPVCMLVSVPATLLVTVLEGRATVVAWFVSKFNTCSKGDDAKVARAGESLQYLLFHGSKYIPSAPGICAPLQFTIRYCSAHLFLDSQKRAFMHTK